MIIGICDLCGNPIYSDDEHTVNDSELVHLDCLEYYENEEEVQQ